MVVSLWVQSPVPQRGRGQEDPTFMKHLHILFLSKSLTRELIDNLSEILFLSSLPFSAFTLAVIPKETIPMADGRNSKWQFE